MFPARIQAGQYKRPKLQDYNGNPVPFRWFNAGRKIAEAYVVSSFAILTFAMRKRTLDGAWLQSSVYSSIYAKWSTRSRLKKLAPTHTKRYSEEQRKG
jgi:hypothetical protein